MKPFDLKKERTGDPVLVEHQLMMTGIHLPRRLNVAAMDQAELPIIPALHLDLIITMLRLREVKEVGMLLLLELKEVGMLLLLELKEVGMNHHYHHEPEDEAVHVR